MTAQSNATDPVDDPAYPGITAAHVGAGPGGLAFDDVAEPPEGWDTDLALTPQLRGAHEDVLEPDDAWAALCAHDEAAS